MCSTSSTASRNSSVASSQRDRHATASRGDARTGDDDRDGTEHRGRRGDEQARLRLARRLQQVQRLFAPAGVTIGLVAAMIGGLFLGALLIVAMMVSSWGHQNFMSCQYSCTGLPCTSRK